MGKNITYKDLFSQVIQQIKKYNSYPSVSTGSNQLSRNLVISPVEINANNVSVNTGEVYTAMIELLTTITPPKIISGLTVEETTPTSSSVIVRAGEGYVKGKIVSLKKDTTINIDLDNEVSVFYVNLYINGLKIEKSLYPDQLLLAKIIVPNPGVSSRIINTKDENNPWDAYIINQKEYVLHGDAYGNFEEDTIELLRNNIGDILAENLIGNIRLSENLKVINTSSSIELDSSSLKILDVNSNTLAKFDKNGVFLYNSSGVELSRFTGSDARIGNILITKNSLESENFISGYSGFQLQDSGDAQFNDLTVRGTIYATGGEIGGWTITEDKLYGTTTGIIQTSENVGTGYDGVKLSSDGIEVYDSILGRVVYLPSDGSSPEFSSGTIQQTIFEINTNAILRTSATVGDGSSASYGILINNSGLYGCGANQTIADANLKVLRNGNIRLKGEIESIAGSIGNVTISEDRLSGGLIEGSIIRAAIIETAETTPKIRIDSDGIYYLLTTSVGLYGEAGSGLSGFEYGDDTLYGAGVTAYLFNSNYPVLSIMAELESTADFRLYNRALDPASGTHSLGDLIVVDKILKICETAGSPGTFIPTNGIIENRTDDTGCTQTGRIWFRTDL